MGGRTKEFSSLLSSYQKPNIIKITSYSLRWCGYSEWDLRDLEEDTVMNLIIQWINIMWY